jgi:nodulation protein E
MIRSGGAEVMFAGGAEAMLTFGGIKAWEGLRVLSPTGCRPFCASRDGMVMGEGAAVFVLEEMSRARARGASILAEIRGFGMTADAQDIVLPSQAGAEAAIRKALADSGLGIDDIGYVNAHGTGTLANDRTEAAAIRAVFGPSADTLPVSSTKSVHGHLIGATGAVELLAVVMALQEGVIAPTVGVQSPDAACAIDLVHGAARETSVRAALSNAFAFGGLNAVLALSRL